MASLYRTLIAERSQSPALRLGSIELLDAPTDVLAFERRYGDDRRIVVVNMGEIDIDVAEITRGATVVVHASRTGEWNGTLRAHSAAILRP